MKTAFQLATAIFLLQLLEVRVQSGSPTSFRYEGSLFEGGSLVTGLFDLRFHLNRLAEGGSPSDQVGPAEERAGVELVNGRIVLDLDFGPLAFDGADRWLEVEVRRMGDSNWTRLSPRQKVAKAPYSAYSTAAGSLNGKSGDDFAPADGSLNYLSSRGGSILGPVSMIGTGTPVANLTVETGESPLLGEVLSKTLITSSGQLPLEVGKTYALASVGFKAEPHNVSLGIRAVRNSVGVGTHGLAIGLTFDVDNTVQAGGGLWIGADGNIGIGSGPQIPLQPMAPLHIRSDQFFPHLKIEAGDGAKFGAFLSLDASRIQGGKNYHIFASGGLASEGQGNLVFQNASDDRVVLTLNPLGNVGVGTTLPEARLDVRGDVRVSGSSTFLGPVSLPGGIVSGKFQGGVDGPSGTFWNINANADNRSGGGIAIGDDGGFFDFNDGKITFKSLVASGGLRVAANLSVSDGDLILDGRARLRLRDGTTIGSQADLPARIPVQIEFRTPGAFVWTVPAVENAARIRFRALGGGGGGSTRSAGGGGGGAGAFAQFVTLDAVPGEQFDIVVGGGGKVDTAGGETSVSRRNGAVLLVGAGGGAPGKGVTGGSGGVGRAGQLVRNGADGPDWDGENVGRGVAELLLPFDDSSLGSGGEGRYPGDRETSPSPAFDGEGGYLLIEY